MEELIFFSSWKFFLSYGRRKISNCVVYRENIPGMGFKTLTSTFLFNLDSFPFESIDELASK
jgi:hypothetical protein